MKKLITVLTIAAGVVGVSAAPAAASANAPACPATGDYVVKLTHRQLLGWNDTENRLGPFPVEIPAGTYQLTLASYDDHSVKPGQGHTQPAEVWSLSFEGASGTRIASSAITPDLPADKDLAVFAMGTIELGADAVQVVAEHGFFDAYNPNSVVPLCAALTAVAPAPLGTTASLPAPVPPPAPSAASATVAAEPAPVSGSVTASDPTAVADPVPAAEVPAAAVKGISVSVQPQLTELPNTGVHSTVALVACAALALGLGLLRMAPVAHTEMGA